jgi:RNA polymerase sigma-70 factor (ECF subfamily)
MRELDRSYRSRHSLEDLVSATAERAWRYRESFDSTRDLLPWLRAISRRVGIDQHDCDARNLLASTAHYSRRAGDDGQVEDAFDLTGEAAFSEGLRRALRSLPPRQRQALYLYGVEDLSVSEVARVMGIRAKAADSLIRRGKEGCRRLLAVHAGIPEL